MTYCSILVFDICLYLQVCMSFLRKQQHKFILWCGEVPSKVIFCDIMVYAFSNVMTYCDMKFSAYWLHLFTVNSLWWHALKHLKETQTEAITSNTTNIFMTPLFPEHLGNVIVLLVIKQNPSLFRNVAKSHIPEDHHHLDIKVKLHSCT